MPNLPAQPRAGQREEAGARSVAGRTDGAVVSGVDGSSESTRALALAAELADRMRRTLLPVYAGGRADDDLPAVGTPVETDLGEPVDVWCREPRSSSASAAA